MSAPVDSIRPSEYRASVAGSRASNVEGIDTNLAVAIDDSWEEHGSSDEVAGAVDETRFGGPLAIDRLPRCRDGRPTPSDRVTGLARGPPIGPSR